MNLVGIKNILMNIIYKGINIFLFNNKNMLIINVKSNEFDKSIGKIYIK